MRHFVPALFILALGIAVPAQSEPANGQPADATTQTDNARRAAVAETLRLLDEDSLAVETRIEAVERIAASHLDSAEIWAALGELRVEAGLDHEAISAFERSVRHDSTLHGSWHWIGILKKRQSRDLPGAAQAFERAMAEGGPKAVGLNELAVTRAMMGEMPRALEHWEEAIAEDPDWGVLYANAIKAALQLGQRDKAAELFSRSLEAERFEPIAVLSYTDYLVDAGRGREALDAYAEALAVAPGDPRIRYYYAATLGEEGHRQEATAQYRRTISDAEAAGDDVTASVARKGLFAIEHPQALRDLIQAEEIVGSVSDSGRRARRDLNRAVDLLNPIVLDHPSFWEPRLMRGIAHRRLGENEKARADFDAVLREVADQPNALVNIALIERDKGNHSVAVGYARRAADSAPRDPQIVINAGLVFVNAGRCNDARQMAELLEPLLPPQEARQLMAPLTDQIAGSCR